MERVEEDAVGLDGADHGREGVDVARALPARAGVPRIVIDEDADADGAEAAGQVAQRVQAARHVAVKVELVPVVEPDARVGVPEDKGVVPAEAAYASGV